MKYDIKLRPIHYACVSGGKDSLYMLGLILANQDKYPLEMVVHYQLEIDWPFAEHVIDEMEKRCKKVNIKFVRIKPRKSYMELYDKYGMPNRLFKWCNYKYKLDCVKQLNDWIKSQNCRPVAYIGLCSDEKKRFKYNIGDWKDQDVCYPLAEEGIEEKTILEWAANQEIFGNWYKLFDRQGCMFCPMIKRKEMAYMYLVERERYDKFINLIRKHEASDKCKLKGYTYWNNMTCDQMHERIITKWVPKLLKECEDKDIDIL